ncbi:hypothetical protein LAZ67_2003299 [Cordylochernes scorpioides]|uniref:HAT C-terminal dimerisation domain-containing protein n=1 Tax=Cordylochernes scorpioides TaxID=51811 RepID=A0ABY6K648_9ARAC|nr:hypothetical protein LAZ67_2003299 [Cordylochernes scorpioides]
MNIEVENENIKLFRTAYNIAKTNRPYSDYENHITLQTLNGIKLGSTLHSRYSATQIINHIACEMRKMLVAKILSTNSKITILIDESTTLSNKSTLVIFLKAYLGGESIDYIFFDLCELQCQDSENIEKELLNTLYKHGLNEEYLKENWIAIATDGASVMVGRHSGVVTRLKQKFPKLFAWHCLNHRLELSVGDTIKEVRGINHFKAFMDKLYSLYSQSPKNCRALEEACHELGTRFAKVGRILGVRWISSSFRTIKTVWESYESLHHHFKSSTYLDSTYQGLLRRLESPEFILDLGLMYDTLQEMSMLSLELQSRTTTLQKAEHIIKRTIRVIESFKTSPGEKSLLALEAAENLVFRSVTLVPNAKIIPIDRKKILLSIIEKLKLRLCTESNEDNEQLIKDISALEPNNFDAENVRYGEVEMRRICRRFNLDEMKCINGLRDFVDDENNVPETLQPFFRAISTLPCSTAECERGFSLMNDIITNLRTSLLISNVSNLMFINSNGPPIEMFQPKKYVQSWLLHHRSSTDTRSRVFARKNTDASRQSLWDIFIKKAAESHRILVEVYSDHSLAERTCQKWFAPFKSGSFDLEDEERPGAPPKYEDEELREGSMKIQHKHKRNSQKHLESLSQPFSSLKKKWE